MKRKLILALLLGAASTPLWAAECTTVVDSTDAMQFVQKAIVVPKACKQFTVTLRHTGKLPKAAMGHNWVLSKPGDMAAINTAGIKAGLAAGYLPKGDARVLAASKLIGGGESTTVKVDVARLRAGETYAYFCSFPGHAALMKGTLKLG